MSPVNAYEVSSATEVPASGPSGMVVQVDHDPPPGRYRNSMRKRVTPVGSIHDALRVPGLVPIVAAKVVGGGTGLAMTLPVFGKLTPLLPTTLNCTL